MFGAGERRGDGEESHGAFGFEGGGENERRRE